MSRWLYFILFVLFISGCSFSSNINTAEILSPEEIVTKFYNGLIEQNFTEAYELLASYEKEVITKEDLIREYMGQASSLDFLIYDKKMVYHIYNLKRKSEKYKRIIFSFSRKTVDLQKIILSTSFPEDADIDTIQNKIKSNLAEKYSKQQMPIKEITQEITVVKEYGQWRVDLGKAINAKKRESIQQKKILNTEAYKKFIVFSNIKTSQDNNGVVWISGILSNNGNKKVKYIKIKMYYYDKSGKQIYENESYPLSLAEQPLKQNFNKQFLTVSYIPLPNWGGKYQIEIIRIDFVKD